MKREKRKENKRKKRQKGIIGVRPDAPTGAAHKDKIHWRTRLCSECSDNLTHREAGKAAYEGKGRGENKSFYKKPVISPLPKHTCS